MSKIRQRTKNLLYAGFVGALTMGLIAGGIGAYFYVQHVKTEKRIRSEYETKLTEAERLLNDRNAARVTIVAANTDMKAGEKVQPQHISTVRIPVSEVPQDAIVNENDVLNKTLKIDLKKNSALLPSMLFDDGPTPRDLRYQEFQAIRLPSKLQKNDFVDVRIGFPTGQDYIVLAKKKVIDVLDGTVWHQLNEKDILLMSSAMVDAYLHGGQIYALRYVDPYMQAEAVVNYPANAQVLELMEQDPNVLEKAKTALAKTARKALEGDLERHAGRNADGQSSYVPHERPAASGSGYGVTAKDPYDRAPQSQATSSPAEPSGQWDKNEIVQPLPADAAIEQSVFDQSLAQRSEPEEE